MTVECCRKGLRVSRLWFWVKVVGTLGLRVQVGGKVSFSLCKAVGFALRKT